MNSKKLLSNAKSLIEENKLLEARSICDEVMKSDNKNVNAMLLLCKCHLGLNSESSIIKNYLDQILILKPDHASATQALRKFYEKFYNEHIRNAVLYYQKLFDENSLSDVELNLILDNFVKHVDPEVQKLGLQCLRVQLKSEVNIEHLVLFTSICLEDFILHSRKAKLQELRDILCIAEQTNSQDSLEETANLMEFMDLIVDKKPAHEMNEFLNVKNCVSVYALLPFADVLIKENMLSECTQVIDKLLEILPTAPVIDREGLNRTLLSVRWRCLLYTHCTDELAELMREEELQLSPYERLLLVEAGITVPDVSLDGVPEGHERLIGSMILWDKDRDGNDRLVELYEFLQSRPGAAGHYEWFICANLLQKAGQVEEAERACSRALDYHGTHVLLGRMAVAAGKLRQAARELRRALNQYPEMDLLLETMDVLERAGDHEELVRLVTGPDSLVDLKDIETCDEKMLRQVVGSALYCPACLDATLAVGLARHLVKTWPNTVANWILLGDTYAIQNNINCSFRSYTRAQQLLENDVTVLLRLGNIYALSYEKLKEENEYHKSLEYYKQALFKEPTSDVIDSLTKILYLHAEVCLQKLQLCTAAENIQEIMYIIINCTTEATLLDSHWLIMGQSILLATMGNICHLLNLTDAFAFISEQEDISVYGLAENCLHRCGRTHAKARYNLGLLQAHQLNQLCPHPQRGQASQLQLYLSATSHLKASLSHKLVQPHVWQLLGRVMLRHAATSAASDNKRQRLLGRTVVEIQHCFFSAIAEFSDSNKSDSIDPETGYYLGLLYLQEDRLDLAEEVYTRLQIEHPQHLASHLGAYLVSRNHDDPDQRKWLLSVLQCYTFRENGITDEHQLDSDSLCSHQTICTSLVSLLCRELANPLLQHCLLRDGPATSLLFLDRPPVLMLTALRDALDFAGNKHTMSRAISQQRSPADEREADQFTIMQGLIDVFLGLETAGLEKIKRTLLNYDAGEWGKYFQLFSKIESDWTKPDISISDKQQTVSEMLECVGLATTEVGIESDKHIISQFELACARVCAGDECEYLPRLTNALPLLFQSAFVRNRHRTECTVMLTSLLLLSSTGDLNQLPTELLDRIQDERMALIRCFSVPDAKQQLQLLRNCCVAQPEVAPRLLLWLQFALQQPQFEQLPTELLERLARPWIMAPEDLLKLASILHKCPPGNSKLKQLLGSSNLRVLLHKTRLFAPHHMKF